MSVLVREVYKIISMIIGEYHCLLLLCILYETIKFMK